MFNNNSQKMTPPPIYRQNAFVTRTNEEHLKDNCINMNIDLYCYEELNFFDCINKSIPTFTPDVENGKKSKMRKIDNEENK